MRQLIIILSIIAVLVSCEKYEHTEFKDTRCELCSYAEELVGEYRGFDSSVSADFNDSVSVFVEHIFLGNSQLEDSTIMFFKLSFIYDNHPTTPIIDTMRINSDNGSNMDYDFYLTNKFRSIINLIRPQRMVLNANHQYIGTNVVWHSGELYKQ